MSNDTKQRGPYFADRFDADGLFYVFDEDRGGEEVQGPFDTFEEALAHASRINAGDDDYLSTQAGARLSEQDEIVDGTLQEQFREHYPDGIGEPS